MFRVLAPLIFYSIFVLLTQTSCQKSKRPNVLILAFDSLSALDVQCSEPLLEKENSGFAELCKNSVRFTHYYTTSTQTMPALASLMTGLSPHVSAVHDTNSYVSSEAVTLNEVAVAQNYKTFMITSNPLVIRKSNLHQGVLNFEDSLTITDTQLHRSFAETAGGFKSWLEDELGAHSFFATLYFSDLNYIKKKSEFEQLESQLISSDENFDEIDSQLFQLIDFLKRHKSWHNTLIVLAGLNGQSSSDRPIQNRAQNLHSENIQTTLLIKPLSKERDQPINWKLDHNVNTLDLYATLYEFLLPVPNTNSTAAQDRNQNSISLMPYLNIDSNRLSLAIKNKFENRLLIAESFYENRLNYAIIHDYSLYMQNEKKNWVYFNSLVDRPEVLPQRVDISELSETLQSTLSTLEKEIAKNDASLASLNLRSLGPDSGLRLLACESLLKKNDLLRENLKKCSDPLMEDLIKYIYAEELGFDADTYKKTLQIKINHLRQLVVISKLKQKNQMIFPIRQLSSVQLEMLKKVYYSTSDNFLKTELKFASQ